VTAGAAATGTRSAVIIQNSGLGNLVDPLTSAAGPAPRVTAVLSPAGMRERFARWLAGSRDFAADRVHAVAR
jgi:hypothetical protein